MGKIMADPVKNTDVEDVLSSIRRLVSEDKRPLQPNSSGQNAASSADRLVLTPALRVADSDGAGADLRGAADEDVNDELDVLLAETDSVSDHNLDLDAAHGVLPDVDQSAPLPQSGEAEEGTLDTADGLSDRSQIVDADHDADTQTGEAALLLTDPALPQDAVETAPTDDDDNADHPSALSAKIAALETAIADIPDAWDPDTEGQDAYAGSEQDAMVWEDIEEPAATQPVVPPLVNEPQNDGAQTSSTDADRNHAEEHDADDAAGFSMAGDDQLLDEDTLREMIGKIVHEELQGALGERITRNVRRLVRREIHRALTARDLD